MCHHPITLGWLPQIHTLHMELLTDKPFSCFKTILSAEKWTIFLKLCRETHNGIDNLMWFSLFGAISYEVGYHVKQPSFFAQNSLRGLIPKNLQNVATGSMAPRPVVPTMTIYGPLLRIQNIIVWPWGLVGPSVSTWFVLSAKLLYPPRPHIAFLLKNTNNSS